MSATATASLRLLPPEKDSQVLNGKKFDVR